MFAMADALSHQPYPRGNRVAVISMGGGLYEAGYGIACNEFRGSEKDP